ncbi:cobalt-precorrin-6A reductase [Antrihabitans sp. NCIMB 15449]|uniref:Cobalt-precorrin-6A reductase n=1 Tax=Antrihabitans spumae TaxID=3373370 RepID=A0ABW7JRH3_9NOCA
MPDTSTSRVSHEHWVKVLLLGGSGEARELAELLTGEPGIDVVSSLAGRLRNPRLPDGEVRVGGFGGAEGLRNWLHENLIDALVVATHPFAARMTSNAIDAATALGLPYVILRRPPWLPGPDDHWSPVESMAAAAAAIPEFGDRVFLTVGRQGVDVFAEVGAWFLIRAIDRPSRALPPRHELLLERGPFSVEHELALLENHGIDVLVTKNSGGDQTVAKLAAARMCGLPVIVVDRPDLGVSAAVVDTVDGVVNWLRVVRGSASA